MVSTTYRGYGLEIYGDRTVVVRYGIVHCARPTRPEAEAFIDGREQVLAEIASAAAACAARSRAPSPTMPQ